LIKQCFAQGKGKPPRIAIRSGRMSLAQANGGRTRIAWFLRRAYQFGHIVLVDIAEATAWYTLAANKGHASSQVYLARMFETQITEINAKEKAYFWFGVAASLRNSMGIAGKERVSSLISTEQRENLELQIQVFRAN
jgi:TPR repeat protein